MRRKTLDSSVDLNFIEVDERIDSINSMPIVNGVVIEDVRLTAGVTTRINHGLGRKLTGWILVDLQGASTTGRIERDPGTAVAPEPTAEQLWLKATGWGATITVSLWVF